MSRLMLRSNGKPPLARSPIQLRSRSKTLQQPAGNAARSSPPGSLIKAPLPRDVEKSELRPEYHNMSCELRALAKLVNEQLGNMNDAISDGGPLGSQRSPLFERGRFYDEYSARRNERLRRKKGAMQGYEKKTVYDLGVRVESAMKRGAASKYDNWGKSVAAAAAATPQRRVVQTPRYSLRSSSRKENKKPPLPAKNLVENSVGVTQRKASVRRVRKV